jgi:uncharacterized protein (TIGR02145 family)
MKKALILAGAAVLAIVACNKTPENNTEPVDFSQYKLRVEPVITRATETNFETGDQVGMTVVLASGDYATNVPLTHDGTAFSGDLNWYEDGSETSTLKAYYPYSGAEPVPSGFMVQVDQSAGVSSSDFISAVKENVLPSANAVTMTFKHQLSRLAVTLKNNTGKDIEQVVISEVIPKAVISADDLTAKPDLNAKKAGIIAYKQQEDKYLIIIPNQTVAPVVTVKVGGKDLSSQLAESTLEPGKQYSISVVVNKEEIKVVLAGDIENWGDGGEITGDPTALEEKLEEGYIVYAGTKYTVAQMKDGKWWMTQNLAYLPEGATPSTDNTAVTAGVFAPLKINDAQTAAEFTTDPDVVAANGYLYQAEFALGLKVGDLQSAADAQKLEGAQGICPKGWHVPTVTDITGLVGKAVSPIETNAQAPYYDGANGSIALLNADGFNMAAVGMVSIQDNTKTSGLLQGFMAAYPDHLCSSMFCGSTYAGVTYNTSGDETSGVKNLQFYGLMPMTNKASEDQYTCNGTKVSYRIAGPLRCVRN